MANVIRAWLVASDAYFFIACGGDGPSVSIADSPGASRDAGVKGAIPGAGTPAAPEPQGGADAGNACTNAASPIAAPAARWTFVDVPESRCMNGSATGFGINPGPATDRLLVYFEGGGACFDPVTCLAVGHASGFARDDLAPAVKGLTDGILSRTDPKNPFRDWSFVFVPYCTGDVHAGANPNGPSGRAHVGFANVTHLLERVVPAYASVERVLVSGSSAGGFGAAYNFDQIARGFSCSRARVDLLDDAGIPMGDSYLRPCLQELWRTTWGLDRTLPSDCPDCGAGEKGGLSAVLPFLAAKYPTSRFAYLSATQDITIRTFFGFGFSKGCASLSLMDGNLFEAGLLDVRTRVLGGSPNAAVYSVGDLSALQHTFLGEPLARTVAAGQELDSWLTAFDGRDPRWGSVGP
jgi:hypothetical protein